SRQGSLERIIDSSPITKAERKKLEKYNKFNIDLQALFAAVEHKQLDRARGILETTNVDINSAKSCPPKHFLIQAVTIANNSSPELLSPLKINLPQAISLQNGLCLKRSFEIRIRRSTFFPTKEAK
ncbi:hypothetical protein AVEN_172408-1, partial [Araneus ventricosus]